MKPKICWPERKQYEQLSLTKNETPSFDNSVGPRVFWKAEAAQLTESKPILETVTVKLGKLTALIPVSEELSEDAPSLDAYLRRTVAEKFTAEINRCLISGTGAPEPIQGVLNANCLVSMAKESGQSADTVVFANIVNMVSRMYAPCFNQSAWIVNQDVMPMIYQMTLEGTSNSTPVFLPPGGASGSPYSTLFGRPLIPVQACPTLGDQGDILLCDFSRYLMAVKSTGLRADVSMHLYFDFDMLAYRFVMRIGGSPLWATSITPASASGNTLSCFVAIDERS